MFPAATVTTVDPDQHWSSHCRHEETEVRSRANRAGVVTHVKQCLKCGRWAGTVKRRGVVPPFDELLPQRVEAERSAFYAMRSRQRHAEFEEHRSHRKREYQRYLASEAWRRKRAMVLRRCDGRCEACGVFAASEVHHVAYPERFGDEPLWDLRGVCRSCHARIHGRHG